jgi:hypothetical protein
MSNINIEAVREKADILMQENKVETHNFQDVYLWWSKTWSLESGYGRWSIYHGKYCGYVTNASVWHEDKDPFSSKSSLRESLGTLFHRFSTLLNPRASQARNTSGNR